MTLLLPPHVLREQRVERDRRILRCTTMDDRRCQEYTTKLKHLSPDMWMVRAQDMVDSDLPLRPGYYHILVVNEGEAMTVIPITNNGAYVEPGDWIFDHLPRMNLRDRRVRDRLAEQEREAEQAAEKERLEGQERRLEVAREVVLSATRAQISMDRTIPWTQSSDGRRGGRNQPQ